MFNFKPRYLSVAGGMLPRSALNALLLVTWPGGARSFNHDDYWSQGDLIYTGRGKNGNQKLEGANRDLANNSRTNYVFEGSAGSGALRFLGIAVSTRRWRARGKGDDGRDRQILRFRLRFQTGGASASRSASVPQRTAGGRGTRRGSRGEQHRKRLRFDPTRGPGQYGAPVQHATPEETAARRERRTTHTTHCLSGSRPASQSEGGRISTNPECDRS
jgi:hypothetical protein